MIHQDIVRAVRKFKRTHPYRGGYTLKLKKFSCVLNVLSHYHDVPVPSLYVTDATKPPSDLDIMLSECKGCYIPSTQEIMLRKFSIISLLHEFRHHLQHLLRLRCNDIEDDANIWSHLIYKSVFPKNYEKIKNDGELNLTSLTI